MNPIIDTHQHLWDLKRFRLPWLDGGGPLAHDHLPQDYQTQAEGLNVVKTVYMEVDVDPTQHVAEAEYVISLCENEDNPMAGATIGGRPGEPEFAAYIDRFAGNLYIKGVRQVLHSGVPSSYWLSDAFVQGVRLLGEKDLHFDLCLRPIDIADGAKLVDLCPETRFVLDHCGNGDVQGADHTQWERDVAVMAQRTNVICKISGIVAGAKPDVWTANDLAPFIRHCAEVFGPDRLVFGSDWPVCTLKATYRQWVEALQQIVADWPEPNQQKLFHDNAVHFYHLNP